MNLPEDSIAARLTRRDFFVSGAAFAVAAGLGAIAPLRASAQTPVHLRVGVGGVEANAQGYYAAEMGFFKKAGLDVELVKLRSGTTTMAAIVGGDLQCGVSNVLSLGSAHLRNVPLEIIAPGAYYDVSVPTMVIAVAVDSPIKSAKDLDGKTVAVISLGGLDQIAFDAWLGKNGADVSSVKIVEVPVPAMAEALQQGRISAAALNDPQLAQDLAAGRVRVFANGYDAIAKVFMQTAWFSTQDWLAANKDVARRFASAIVAAGAWGMANPIPAAKILAKYTNTNESETKAEIRFATKLDPAQIQPVYDAAYKYQLLANPILASDFTWNGK